MDENDHRELLDRLAQEFMERRRRGEHPKISEYTGRHPEMADEIRELFQTIASLEGLKQQQDLSLSDRIQVGAERLKQLGEFSVTRELGRGGMGVVFEAVQETLDRHVALKVLPKQSLIEDNALTRFQREARIAAHLQHPNIVPIYSIGEVEGHHFIAMQYIKGVGWDHLIKRLAAAQKGNPLYVSPAIVDEGHLLQHLAERLTMQKTPQFEPNGMDTATKRPLSTAADNCTGNTMKADQNLYDRCLPPVSRPYDFGAKYYIEAAKMGLQAADALCYAHEQGVWHRDIKPANLILDIDGRVWITDFGIARTLESDNITRTGTIVGTLRFMAPEKFDGRSDVGSDIYSLGLTLYELLTLRPAFEGKNQSELIRRILYDTPPLPRNLNPDIPGDLESIILKATAKNPDLRYKTATAMARDFQRFLDQEPVSAHPVRTPLEMSSAGQSKSMAFRAIGGLLLILVLIAGVMFIKFGSKEASRPKATMETTTRIDSASELAAKPVVTDMKREVSTLAPKNQEPLATQKPTGQEPLSEASESPSELPEKISEIQPPLELPPPPLGPDMRPLPEFNQQEKPFAEIPPPPLRPSSPEGLPQPWPPPPPGSRR